MNEPTAVVVPLLSANEPEAVVASLAVTEGMPVAKGDVLAVVENTKSTEEVLAPADGYAVALPAAGAAVQAGDVLCWVAPQPDWRPMPPPAAAGDVDAPEGLRISRPAAELARELGVDLASLPVGPLVTAAVVRAAAGRAAAPVAEPAPAGVPDGRVVVLGGGGHGRTLVDALRAAGRHELVGVVDDGLPSGSHVSGVEVLGPTTDLARIRAGGVRLAVNGIGGISRPADRVAAFDRLVAAGFDLPAVVHPSAVVEPTATVGPGAQVLAHAYVGSAAEVGFGCLVNTAAVVSHDCRLESYVNVSPGALLAGGVIVGEGAVVGMGVTVNIGVRVGAGARVGNGAVVKADVLDGGLVRAGAVWP